MGMQGIRRFQVPRSKQEALPPPGAFGRDDFHRARFFSAVIEKYATKAETETLVAFARESRLPGLSFADMLESMGSYIHGAEHSQHAIDQLLAHAKKPKEQMEREVLFAEAVRRILGSLEGHDAITLAMAEALVALYPNATRERVMGALAAGNTEQGFNVARVIETMQLTEPAAEVVASGA